MVTQHYRWDFIGLSSYAKPTPETSEKVVDGSTYYEANTSKLYVFYKDTWYEKTATGGGGGGSYTAGDGISIADNVISNISKGITILTTADYNYPTDNPNRVNPAMLPSGLYQLADNSVYIQEEARRNNRADRLYYVSNENTQGYNFIFAFYGNASFNLGTSPISILIGIPATGVISQYNTLVAEDEFTKYIGVTGASDPINTTIGNVGQIYVNYTTQDAFVCTSATGGTYTWKKITA